MKRDISLTGQELKMSPDEIIVTKTDPSGKISYANRTFYKYAGYGPADCIGVQHNIIRHPEMPRCVFKLLWDTIQGGGEVFAYVVNRAKNGDHYWVLAHVTPSFNAAGEIIGYHSNRRMPNHEVLTQHIEPLYQQLLEAERSCESPKDGMAKGGALVTSLLADKQMSYNELIFSLGV